MTLRSSVLLVLAALITLAPAVRARAQTDVPLTGPPFATFGPDHIALKLAGTGLPSQPASFDVTIPASATVVAAYLYVFGRSPAADVDEEILVNGSPVAAPTVAVVNEVGDPLVARAQRADVTALVAPGVTSFTIAGYNQTITRGAFVVAIYRDDAAPFQTIRLLEGNDFAFYAYTAPLGPDTEVGFITFPGLGHGRAGTMYLATIDAEPLPRGDAIWGLAADAAVTPIPASLVGGVSGAVALETDLLGKPVSSGGFSVGAQLDLVTIPLTIPASANYMAFQVESPELRNGDSIFLTLAAFALPEPFCGDGFVDPGEECDDGAGNSDTEPDACRTDCTLPSCGDGVADPARGEECDGSDDAACPGQCLPPGELNECTCWDLNHFQCYEVDRQPYDIMTGLTLDDEFGPGVVDVKRPQRFCNPADKNGEDPTALSDPDHLLGYQIKQTDPRLTRVPAQVVMDQFGTIIVDVSKPDLMMVPTAKDLHLPPLPLTDPIDHFKCYRVKRAGRVRVSGITVEDQFGTLTVDVKKPLRLCVPADKNGGGIINPAAHLMCYKIKSTPPRPLFSGVPFFIDNQFGPNIINVTRATELCVPAVKNPSQASPTPAATPRVTVTPTPAQATPTFTVAATPTFTVAATPTFTAAATPTFTAAATPTRTVTPTVTVTATRTPTPAPTSTAQGTCPNRITFVGTAGAAGVLDAGWTGQSHDSQVIGDGLLTMQVTSCAGAAPTCGVCNYTGPIANVNAGSGDIDSHRCLVDSRVSCASNADCTAKQCSGGTNAGAVCTNNSECPSASCVTIGPCVYYFGSYLPLSAGGVSTCVRNTFQAPVSGTFNEDTGASAGSALLLSTVWTGPTADDPCPKCSGDPTANDSAKGGTCAGGQDNLATCDINGRHPNAIFGDTSLDCRPLIGGDVANLNIDLSNTTGSKTRTLSTANPNCTAPGFTGDRCHCDTCATAAAEACATNADCPGGAVCGGRRCIGGTNLGAPCTTGTQCPGGACGRPGKATIPNECDGGVGDCAFDTGNEWACVTGPFELFCGPSAIHKACATNADCPVPGDTCAGKFRNCYNNGQIGDSVTATGVADPPVAHQSDPTLAALFCIGPTTAPAVNSVAGLPGLGRLELPGHAIDNGTP